MPAPKALTGHRSNEPLPYKYEAIIDLMLAKPQMKKSELAERLGLTLPWLSQIINSSGFRARYNERRREYNAELDGRLTARLYEMAEKGMARVVEKLDDDEAVDERFALEASTRALRALGYGTKPAQGQVVLSEGAPPVSQETLEAARKTIMEVTRVTEKFTVEVPAGEVSQPGGDGPRPAVVLEGEAVEGSEGEGEEVRRASAG